MRMEKLQLIHQKQLKQLGFRFEEISVSPFIKIEDQANELQKSLCVFSHAINASGKW